jgi:uncharacterized membrane protein YjfL (UPF0719 family)
MRKGIVSLAAALTALIGAKAALAQSANEAPLRSVGDEAIRTGIWMVIAIVLFAFAYKLADLMTPGDLKTQLAEGNTALAIFSGSIIIGFALIIAALVG